MRSTGMPEAPRSSGLARRAPARARGVARRCASAQLEQHARGARSAARRRGGSSRRRRAAASVGTRRDAADLGRPRARRRSAARRRRRPPRRRAGARASARGGAHGAALPPRAGVEAPQRAAQLGAPARAAPSTTPPSRAIASSWRRDRRRHLVDRRRRCARDDLRDLVHRLDHALGVAGLRVGLLEDLLGARARPRPPPTRICSSESRDRVDVVAALARSPGSTRASRRRPAWCRPRSRGSASRSRRRCAPRSRRACGSRRPRPRSRGPPRPRAPPRSRRSARAGSCASATLVMISVIWCTWRVFASSWNTMPPACSTRSNTERIFSIARRDDVDARVRLLVRLGGEAERLARARGVELDRGGDVVDHAAHVVEQRRAAAPRRAPPRRRSRRSPRGRRRRPRRCA